ncbi:hypothetical protein K474DRAFT_1664986 [Panus rudis PR-1116 ss-1]|nr:hypothetical protein K474DRAFT_1664986 [Panus rudis PR-1116 ss-1]
MHNKLSQSVVGPLPTPQFFELFINPGAPRILSMLKRVLKKTFSRTTTRSTPQDIQSFMDAVHTHTVSAQTVSSRTVALVRTTLWTSCVPVSAYIPAATNSRRLPGLGQSPTTLLPFRSCTFHT